MVDYSIDAATAASQNFLSWIDTSPAAYMSEGDLPFNMVEQPPDAESMKLDMNRTPRWIIKVFRSPLWLTSLSSCHFSPYIRRKCSTLDLLLLWLAAEQILKKSLS